MGWNFKMITVQMKRELEKKNLIPVYIYFFPLIYSSVTVIIYQSPLRIRAITDRVHQVLCNSLFSFPAPHTVFSSIKNNFKFLFLFPPTPRIIRVKIFFFQLVIILFHSIPFFFELSNYRNFKPCLTSLFQSLLSSSLTN